MAFKDLEKLEREELEALCQILAVELDKAQAVQKTVSCMFAHALIYGLKNPIAIKTETCGNKQNLFSVSSILPEIRTEK